MYILRSYFKAVLVLESSSQYWTAYLKFSVPVQIKNFDTGKGKLINSYLYELIWVPLFFPNFTFCLFQIIFKKTINYLRLDNVKYWYALEQLDDFSLPRYSNQLIDLGGDPLTAWSPWASFGPPSGPPLTGGLRCAHSASCVAEARVCHTSQARQRNHNKLKSFSFAFRVVYIYDFFQFQVAPILRRSENPFTLAHCLLLRPTFNQLLKLINIVLYFSSLVFISC